MTKHRWKPLKSHWTKATISVHKCIRCGILKRRIRRPSGDQFIEFRCSGSAHWRTVNARDYWTGRYWKLPWCGDQQQRTRCPMCNGTGEATDGDQL